MIECYDLMTTIKVGKRIFDLHLVLVHLVKCCSLFQCNWDLELITGNAWTNIPKALSQDEIYTNLYLMNHLNILEYKDIS